MRDEKEEKKHARSNKQQGKATQHTKTVTLYMYTQWPCTLSSASSLAAVSCSLLSCPCNSLLVTLSCGGRNTTHSATLAHDNITQCSRYTYSALPYVESNAQQHSLVPRLWHGVFTEHGNRSIAQQHSLVPRLWHGVFTEHGNRSIAQQHSLVPRLWHGVFTEHGTGQLHSNTA